MNKATTILIFIFACASVLAGPCVFFVHAATISASPASSQILNGLGAWWSFDNKNTDWVGNTTADVSGHGDTGSMANMALPGSSTAGKVNEAFVFDGFSSYVSIASNPLSSMSSPTSACTWANSADITQSAGGFNQTFLNLFTNASNGLRMGSIVSTGVLFISYKAAGISYGVHSNSQIFFNNAWNYVCYVWDGSAISLYVNGSLVPTSSDSSSFAGLNIIGARDTAGDGNWDGELDEMRVYNRALSQTEIQTLYHSSSPTNVLQKGLVGWWTFDGANTPWTSPTAGTANDLSGNGNSGTLTNMTRSSATVAGKIGQALSFNPASNQSVQFTSPSDIPLANTLYTITAWIKPSALGNQRGIVGWGSYGNTNQVNAFRLTSSGECSGGQGLDNYWWGNDLLACSSALTAGAWHFVVAAFDGTTRSIYIDNSLINSDTPGSSHNVPFATDLTIGLTDPDFNEYFSGSLDDVRIYNRPLSATEMTQLYHLGQSIAATSVATATTSPSLVTYWTFDGKNTHWTDATDATTDDSSGNGNLGTLEAMNIKTNLVPGKIGQAFRFDGSATYVASGDMTSQGIDFRRFSVSWWAKTSLSESGFDDWVDLHGISGGETEAMFDPSDGDVAALFVTQGLAGANSLVTTSADVRGAWHLFTVTANASANSATFYVDGVPSVSVAWAPSSEAIQRMAVGSNESNRNIRADIDDVRVYNRSLSAAEVAQLYNGGGSKMGTSLSLGSLSSGLLGEWTFDGKDTPWTSATAGTANDISGNGDTGTLTNMNQKTSPVAGKIGQALSFNGSSGSVSIGDVAPLNLGANPFTLSAWVKIASQPTTGAVYSIIGKGVGGSSGWGLFYYNNSGTFQISLTKFGVVDQLANLTLTPGSWHQIAAVQSATRVDYYLDGAFAGTFSNSSSYVSASGDIAAIGSQSGTSNFFAGSMDDVRVYGRALSSSEIQQLYNGGK